MKSRTTPNGSKLDNPPEETTEHMTKELESNRSIQTTTTVGQLADPLGPTVAPITRRPIPSVVRKPTRHTQVMITLQTINPGRPKHTSARVLAFDTSLAPKECLALLQVISNLLQAYQPKEHGASAVSKGAIPNV